MYALEKAGWLTLKRIKRNFDHFGTHTICNCCSPILNTLG